MEDCDLNKESQIFDKPENELDFKESSFESQTNALLNDIISTTNNGDTLVLNDDKNESEINKLPLLESSEKLEIPDNLSIESQIEENILSRISSLNEILMDNNGDYSSDSDFENKSVHDLNLLQDQSIIIYEKNEQNNTNLNNDSDSNISESNNRCENDDFDYESLSHKSNEDLIEIVKESFYKRLSAEQEKLRHKEESENCLHKMEKQLAQAKADAFVWENKLHSETERLMGESVSARSDLTARLDRVMRKCEAANAEKEDMVVKYATAERKVIIVQRDKEALEKRQKEDQKIKEMLQARIKTLLAEKNKICSSLDAKIQECGISLRTAERLRDDLSARDVKIKWTTNRLQAEVDAHKETAGRLDRALSKICGHEEELRSCTHGEATKAANIEKQLKEMKASLILKTQECDNVNASYKSLKAENDTLRAAHILLETEANTLKVKVSKYEQERVESEELFSSLQTELKNVKLGATELTQRLAKSAAFAEQIESERLKVRHSEEQIAELESRLSEQAIELSSARSKEAELLAFAEKVANNDVQLRGRVTSAEAKIRLLELEKTESETLFQEIKDEKAKYSNQFNSFRKTKKEELEKLTNLLQESEALCNTLRTQKDDLSAEFRIQGRRHAQALKELNRELNKLRKRGASLHPPALNEESVQSGTAIIRLSPDGDSDLVCDSQQESSSSASFNNVNGSEISPSRGQEEPFLERQTQRATSSALSRGSSDVSLATTDQDGMEDDMPWNGAQKDDSILNNGSSLRVAIASGRPTPISSLSLTPDSLSGMPSTEALIERVVKLQKELAKKGDKLDFMEEHISQLVLEIKKKNKIIYHYIMKEETGVLTNNKSDEAKAELRQHGGIMASVFGGNASTGGLTIDLSLEMNRKLQAVLEDTLLKNITLKENLNTLGDEVAKLALQKSRNLS